MGISGHEMAVAAAWGPTRRDINGFRLDCGRVGRVLRNVVTVLGAELFLDVADVGPRQRYNIGDRLFAGWRGAGALDNGAGLGVARTLAVEGDLGGHAASPSARPRVWSGSSPTVATPCRSSSSRKLASLSAAAAVRAACARRRSSA